MPRVFDFGPTEGVENVALWTHLRGREMTMTLQRRQEVDQKLRALNSRLNMHDVFAEWRDTNASVKNILRAVHSRRRRTGEKVRD